MGLMLIRFCTPPRGFRLAAVIDRCHGLIGDRRQLGGRKFGIVR
jgi:hypothetical protein